MNEEIIEILYNISKLLEIKGEPFFKFSAYSNAADILKSGQYDIKDLVEKNKLSEIKGIGKALNEKITDYVVNGKMMYYENLKSELPESLINILKIDGFGPKKILAAFNQLNVKSVEDLNRACEDKSIKQIKGISDNSIPKILSSIEEFKINKKYKNTGLEFDKVL